jgi:hypothetical protein
MDLVFIIDLGIEWKLILCCLIIGICMYLIVEYINRNRDE